MTHAPMAYSSSPSAPTANATRAPTTVDRMTARSASPDVAPLVVTTAELDLAGGAPVMVALEPDEVRGGAPVDAAAEVDPSGVEPAEEELVWGGLPEGVEDDDGGGSEIEIEEAKLEDDDDDEGGFDAELELVLVGDAEDVEEKGNGTRTPPTGPVAGDDDDVPSAADW